MPLNFNIIYFLFFFYFFFFYLVLSSSGIAHMLVVSGSGVEGDKGWRRWGYQLGM
jgi:hypothetical protein